MSLPTAETLEHATSVLAELDINGLLKECSEENIAGPLNISLRGLSTMGSSKKASVLYTHPIDATNRLLPFATAIKQRFVQEGLIVNEKGREKLLLHATVLNTVYVKKGGRTSRKQPPTLELTKVVEEWKEKVLVPEVKVKRISICRMGARNEGIIKGSGGYEEVSVKDLP